MTGMLGPCNQQSSRRITNMPILLKRLIILENDDNHLYTSVKWSQLGIKMRFAEK